jgi:hypothetical protein
MNFRQISLMISHRNPGFIYLSLSIFLLAVVFLVPTQGQPVPDESLTNAPASIGPSGTNGSTNSNSTDAPLSLTNSLSAPAPDTSASPVVSPPPLNIPGSGAGSQTEDLDDIRPPVFFFHFWFWLCMILSVTAAVALLVLLLLRFRPHRQLSPKSAYELALEKLEKARALLREDNPMPYAVFVSETIRTYLGQRFQTPSTRRTTQEFLRIMEGDRTTPLAEHGDLLREFLQSCDMVKFARYQPTLSELEQVQHRAATFIAATKPVVTPAHDNGK